MAVYHFSVDGVSDSLLVLFRIGRGMASRAMRFCSATLV
jgi:hypothetical protein